MKIYIKQLYDDKGKKIPITLPKKGSDIAAGYDIVATSDPKIVGEKHEINYKRVDYIEYETNLYIAPEATTFHTLIHPRSSISKYNLVLANSIGLVDNDYRGMVICRFKYIWQLEDFQFSYDRSKLGEDLLDFLQIYGKINSEKIYKKGDAIAQLVFEPTVQAHFELVDDLNQTKRGNGGFGSTDKPKIEPKREIPRTIIEKYSE